MTTSESFRNDVGERLNEIVHGSDPHLSVSFPSCLSAEERKYIHNVSEQFGLRHVSQGKGDSRHIVVSRNPEKAARRGLATADRDAAAHPRLLMPREAWEALEHPLVEHASGNVEAVNAGAPVQAVGRDKVAELLGLHDGARPGRAAPGATGPSPGGATGPPETPLLRVRQGLPAWNARDEVLRAVAAHQVTMVVGETGCGKSTQVPQFLIEALGREANLIVTQPRRISAVSLAHRVSQERGENTGQTVGYSVHLDHATSGATRLLFCTNGVFRRRLLADPLLAGVTHLVLDELHEREKVADFLLIAVKELLEARPDMRVVLMSATLQHEKFREYFVGCGEVHIPGRTFPVQEYFLEDLAPMLHQSGHWKDLGPGFAAGGLGYGNWANRGNEKSFKYQCLVSHARERDGLCGYTQNAPKPLEGGRLEEGLFLHDVLQQTKGVQFDLSLIEALLLAVTSQRGPGLEGWVRGNPGMCRGVLVFLPGWNEIDSLKRRLRAHHVLGDPGRFCVLPLHSQIRLEQQREVFKAMPPGVCKIVLSTNIAETAITVDDIEVVIDTGRAKETSYDSLLRIPTLNLSWISRASMAQRAGRAGRTSPGVCCRMFSSRRADMLDAHRPPEMLRSPLDDVFLHATLLLTRRSAADVHAAKYLAKAPDPPDERSVQNAESLLREIGALAGGGELTALGVHLSALPLSPQFAKIVMWATLFGVIESALTIVSALQYSDPFVSIGDGERMGSLADANKAIRNVKKGLCSPDCSDHIALLRATELFAAAKARGGDGAARQFCENHSLSFNKMQNVLRTRTKLRDELKKRGMSAESAGRNDGDTALLSAALCVGLFPNLALRPGGAGGKMKVVGGRLEAWPHSSSVTDRGGAKGRSELDAWCAAAPAQVDDLGRAASESTTCWLGFNELSQVEDHYSLSGLTPVPLSAILLFCGEGDLVVREVEAPAPAAPSGGGDAEAEVGAAADGGMSGWWADAAGGTPAAPSGAGQAQAPAPGGADEVPDDAEDDVAVSVGELGDWFTVRLRRKSAMRLQALRAMLRLLFRGFCSDPSRMQELLAEGQVGAVVLDLAAQMIRAEVSREAVAPAATYNGGGGAGRYPNAGGGGGAGRYPSAGPRSQNGGALPASRDAGRQGVPFPAARPAYEAPQRPKGAQKGKSKGKGKAAPERRCDQCTRQVAVAQGCSEVGTGMWYCFDCWQSYFAEKNKRGR